MTPQPTKKVLFTSHTANFSKFNRPFMRWFKEQGYEVHYASAGEEEVLDCDKHFTVSFERSPFKLNNIRAIGQLKKIIDAEHYDIIHTHTPMGGVVTRLAAIKARKQGTRVIYTAHGFHFFIGAPLQNWLIYYPIEKMMAHFTDTLITINKEDYERAKAKLKTDVQYVPGVGIDPKKFDISMSSVDKQKLRMSLGLKRSDFILLYAAELSKRKNQLALIKSLSRFINNHADVHLLLSGQDSLKNACQELVAELGLENKVHFLGYRTDIPQIMHISNLAVSSSKQEGLPMNVIEAMYIGLPIVATDCRGNRDLIQGSKGGFVIPQTDGILLSQKVEQLYSSKLLRAKLAKEARKVAARYVTDNIMRNMAEVYRTDEISNKPVRVLHIVTSMNRAGLETMIMNYYRNIDRSKIQFDFLMHRSEESDYDNEIRRLGGKIYRLPSISITHVMSYPKALEAFFRTHHEYKVVHAHMDSLSAFPLAAAKRNGVLIRIAHSHNNSFDFDIKYPVRLLMKHFISSNATDLYACSIEAGKFMFGSRAKYTVINNAINAGVFTYNKAQRSKVRSNLGVQNQLVIGHVGRFSNQKNHDLLIDIFNELYKIRKDVSLLLVGTGENEHRIRKKVNGLGLEGSVRFLGSRSDVTDLMQAMDVFVMPSRYEGLPVVSIEAQATGLPCVLSDVITRELDITRSSVFISNQKKPAAWAQAILAAGKSERHKTDLLIRDNGYDVTVEAKQLASLYLERISGLGYAK